MIQVLTPGAVEEEVEEPSVGVEEVFVMDQVTATVDVPSMARPAVVVMGAWDLMAWSNVQIINAAASQTMDNMSSFTPEQAERKGTCYSATLRKE
jgi:hypothetical protein